MKREELLKSKEYWIVKIQQELFEKVTNYLKEHDLTQTQFAEKLGVSKSYVSQLLNGDYDSKISKLVELALAIEKVPDFNLDTSIREYLQKDKTLILKAGNQISVKAMFEEFERMRALQFHPYNLNISVSQTFVSDNQVC